MRIPHNVQLQSLQHLSLQQLGLTDWSAPQVTHPLRGPWSFRLAALHLMHLTHVMAHTCTVLHKLYAQQARFLSHLFCHALHLAGIDGRALS